MTNFDTCVQSVLAHEGEWSDHPDDRGSRTRWGISSRAHPEVDLERLTKAGAAEIYRENYWDRVRGDELPAAVRQTIFDCAVNAGVAQSIKFLQRACVAQGHPIIDDGVVGPKTLAAAAASDPVRLSAAMLGLRLAHMTELPSWISFGRGWARRVAQHLTEI